MTNPGTTVTATATRDEVPALALTVVSPSRATVTDPPLSQTEYDRSSDLAFEWIGLTAEVIAIHLTEGIDDVSSIHCEAPGAEGTAVIDAARLTVYSASSISSDFDRWTVRFGISYGAVWPDGSAEPTNLTFR